MACPFIDEVVDEGALIIRRAFQRQRIFRDRSDPLAFPDSYLYELYRFSREGIVYICRLLRPYITHNTLRNKALTVPDCMYSASLFCEWNISIHRWRCREYQQIISLPLCASGLPVFKKTAQCVHHLPWSQSNLYH